MYRYKIFAQKSLCCKFHNSSINAPKNITSLWMSIDWVMHAYGHTSAREPGGEENSTQKILRNVPFFLPPTSSHLHIMNHRSTSLSQGSQSCRSEALWWLWCSCSSHLPASVILLKPCCRAFCLWLPRALPQALPLPFKGGILEEEVEMETQPKTALLFPANLHEASSVDDANLFQLRLQAAPPNPALGTFHPIPSPALVSYSETTGCYL